VRERLTHATWLALILTAFCLPLYIGLGNADLQGDEAGHSFSVDRILEIGDWMVPKSSPHPNAAFLEKPPLKFWIVAAGIKAGLPHNEFGLRFWDPIFAGIAFFYVFAIGRRMVSPVCGAAAVMLLFVHRNLLFEHGLRSNNMEAPLLLAYCGGVFHYLAWTTSERLRSRRLHTGAVALYFALGFMVKFVAALFLPFVLGIATLLIPRYRGRFFGDWRRWADAIGLGLVVIAPWFVYCTIRFGRGFWRTIFGDQVYTRLTAHLDPSHLNPWNHYLMETYLRWSDAHAFWLIAAGAVLLAADTIRRRWTEGLVILMWFVVPVTIISFGTSKLYHYAYPFLPPVALAGGYILGRLWELRRTLARFLGRDRAFEAMNRWSPQLARAVRRPPLREFLFVLALTAVAAFAWTAIFGPFTFNIGDVRIRNSRLLRPALVGALLLIVIGRMQVMLGIALALVIIKLLPVPAYTHTLRALGLDRPVFRPVRDCILQVGSRAEMMAAGSRGMYYDGFGPGMVLPFNHEFNYYFRHVLPWAGVQDSSPERLYQFVSDPAEQRPLLMSASRYHALLPELTKAAGKPLVLPRVTLHDNVQLVLPGPYAVCDPTHLRLMQRQ
jgi:4-amino-4-deoxy-L-arabinose transferase-like glycosyltransferase